MIIVALASAMPPFAVLPDQVTSNSAMPDMIVSSRRPTGVVVSHQLAERTSGSLLIDRMHGETLMPSAGRERYGLLLPDARGLSFLAIVIVQELVIATMSSPTSQGWLSMA